MKISIISIITVDAPCFQTFADSLFHSIERSDLKADYEFELIAVLRPDDFAVKEELLTDAVAGRFDFKTCTGLSDAGHLSAALNLGIQNASGDYLVFLRDYSAVSPSFAKVVSIAANKNYCFRGILEANRRLGLNADGSIASKETGGFHFVQCLPSSASISFFGVPSELVRKVEGFDESYLTPGREDLDLFVRLTRAGGNFQTSKRAVLVVGPKTVKAPTAANARLLATTLQATSRKTPRKGLVVKPKRKKSKAKLVSVPTEVEVLEQ